MKKIFLITVILTLTFSSLFLTRAWANDSKSESIQLPETYLPFNDSSESPVKILAYRVDYAQSGESTVTLLLKNTSDLRVVGFQGTLELFDKNGHHIDSIQGEPFFLFKDRTPLAVSPNPSLGTVFVVEEGHRLTTVKPQITQVLFEDQSIWRG